MNIWNKPSRERGLPSNPGLDPGEYSGLEAGALGLQGAGLLASVYAGYKADKMAQAQAAEEQRRYDASAGIALQDRSDARLLRMIQAQQQNEANVEARRKRLREAYARYGISNLGTV